MKPECECPDCGNVVAWEIYAAEYPMPMARSCSDHVGALLDMDQAHAGATSSYVIRRFGA